MITVSYHFDSAEDILTALENHIAQAIYSNDQQASTNPTQKGRARFIARANAMEEMLQRLCAYRMGNYEDGDARADKLGALEMVRTQPSSTAALLRRDLDEQVANGSPSLVKP